MATDVGLQHRKTAYRRWVHVLLVVSAVASLVAFTLAAGDPVLTIHIGFGLLFGWLVAVHLVQRRRVGTRLVGQMRRRPSLRSRPVRLAVSDLLLLIVTAGAIGSGLWDWLAPHANWRGIHWHAISGMTLAVLLTIHTMRRGRRLLRSHIR
jgi:hypothetical protein